MTIAAMAKLVDPRASAEQDLVARLARQERAALEELIDLYQPQVARQAQRLMAWRGDADDVVQDVFLTAMTKAGSFRRGSSLSTWLTIITLNRCRTIQRRRAVWQRAVRLLALGRPNGTVPADARSIEDETSAAVRAAVGALPQRDREVIVLFYLEQKPLRQIAELQGATKNAIEIRLHRARAKLRESLGSLAEGI